MTILEELIQYSNDVLEGKIIACEKHKQACKRFLKDVERSKTDDFPYKWVEEEAQRIVNWFRLLRHSKGILAGQPIELNIWQKFVVCNLYGWYHKETGYRRFRKGYIQVGRKNAKSQMMAGIGLYECGVTSSKNNELNEIYSAGTKRDQSRIIFEEAKLMLNGSPLREYFKVLRTEIVHKKTGSFIKALSKEDGQKGDGTNPQLGLLDEYHQHETTEFYDLFDTGMKARKEPLLLIITTAGVDLNVPCYQQEYKYCSSILDGTVENDSYFVMICELDKDDDISNIENWKKANPIVMTYEEGIAGLKESFEIAREVPEKMRTFLTKNLNVWIQQKENGYMDMEKWRECGQDFDLEMLRGMECIVGIDLSAVLDLTSIGFVFKKDGKYIVLSHSFIPEETLQKKMKTDKVPYDLWVKQGWITVTSGAYVDYQYIKKYIQDMEKKYDWHIREICYDKWNATQFAQEMASEGYTMVEIIQGTKTLSEPTKDFRAQVYAKNIVHNNNPVLTWAISNAVLKVDVNENIMLDKSKSTERIDPIAAVIDAYVRAMRLTNFNEKSVYEERGLLML
ncbi:terminase large subunit [Caloramator sp. Dgby_cultured_2]|uniref:terminase large subunit n=1 Tax=Caloramator sp. Dgby_cultured_2 TaxID=3029174 RepID=UPI00237D71D2|nr:terminase TerL endonuclease subunit [Caloramator sp. Dgby_cultured_2]WDU84217.1 terminase large subunit [Caloramator sp. Dgby_cultured_2]